MSGAARWHRAAFLGSVLVVSSVRPWTLDLGRWTFGPGEARAEDVSRTFHIPAQRLANALVVFAEQSGLAVMAPAALVRDKTAPAVEGNMPPLTALDRLLKGSGLKYLHSVDGALTIVPAGSSKTIQRGRGAPRAEVVPVVGIAGGSADWVRSPDTVDKTQWPTISALQ